MREYIVLLLAAFVATAATGSVPEKVLEAQGSIVRILNIDIPALGYGASYSSGTGYIIDSDKGYILTNHHVIDGNLSVLVYFNRWEKADTLPAFVVYSDEDRDLAVLTVREDISDRRSLSFADTLSMEMGDDAYVLGYPATGLENFEMKYAKGVVGSHVTDSIIQLSATVNPGNSGGPALNEKGEVIGTIYSKLLNRFENVGNILSNRLNLWTLDSADKYMTDSFYVDYFKERDSTKAIIGIKDTVNIEAYHHISMAHKHHAASERVDPDTTARMALVEQAIVEAAKAIELDEENIVMRMHHINLLFDAATLSCMGSSDKDEKGSSDYARRVNLAFEETDEVIDELPRDERKKARSFMDLAEHRFEKVVGNDEVNCKLWSEIVENIEDRRKLRRIRYREFERYLDYGHYPYYLNRTLKGVGVSDPFWAAGGRKAGFGSNFFVNYALGYRGYSVIDKIGDSDTEINLSGPNLGMSIEYYGLMFGSRFELSYSPMLSKELKFGDESRDLSDIDESNYVEVEVGVRFLVIEASANISGLTNADDLSQIFMNPLYSYGLSWPRIFMTHPQDFTAGFGVQVYGANVDLSDGNRLREAETYYIHGSYYLEDVEGFIGFDSSFGDGLTEFRFTYAFNLE